MTRRALVFQHMDDEPPGLYGEFLTEAGAALDIVQLHRGESIPGLAPYDFLLVMGGAMDVWETAAYPWLTDEIAAIAEWVMTRDRPFFGVCLGLQLLALAAGGEVGKSKIQEVGMGSVALTELGRHHAMTCGLARKLHVMQWHHAEVSVLPEGAEVLAASANTEVQIMALGSAALATQFHGELTPALMARWADIPQYIQWLEEAHGAGAYAKVRAAFAPRAAAARQMSRRLFDNLITGTRIRAGRPDEESIQHQYAHTK